DQAGGRGVRGALDEVVHIRVLIRRDLQANALVQPVAGHAVQLLAADLQDRDAAAGADVDGLGEAVVVAGALRDVQGGRRDVGVQALHHGVAADDQLVATEGIAAVVRSGCPALRGLLALVRLVVDAVLRLRGRPLTTQAAALLPGRTLRRALLVLACAAVASRVASHRAPWFCVNYRAPSLSPQRRFTLLLDRC